ncbi:hypothetical protein KCG44_12365 [Pacificimonas sp. WHA3]|uniref:Polysaccharide chain length determinant N-terminal domain-containing protein n=1 Tax=Pacificimonas pallii TaxID=2827236 RepID=A0ABS6SGN2_9SPHN|nr:hypothetical protein [Pacificimonas pallii]MBV7257578.1 hypothetical protein [Pacificimonas pallii]
MFETSVTAAEPEVLTWDTVIAALRRWWYIPLSIMTVSLVATIIYLHSATPTYRASMVVSPIFSDDNGAGGGLARYTDLASSIGLDIGGQNNLTHFSLFMETLQSYELAERLGRDQQLLPELYPALWDADAQRWRDPDSVRSAPVRWIRALLNRPPTSSPNLVDLQKYLKTDLTVDDPPTPFKTISYSNSDPEFAAAFLQSVYENADSAVRENVRQRATQEARFIEGLLAGSSVSEHRLALSDLLAQKQRLIMMSSIDLPFSAQLQQPPVTANDPASPRPLLLIVMSIFFSIVLGFFIVIALSSKRSNEQPS